MCKVKGVVNYIVQFVCPSLYELKLALTDNMRWYSSIDEEALKYFLVEAQL